MSKDQLLHAPHGLQPLLIIDEPPLWSESFWVVPEYMMLLTSPSVDADESAAGYSMTLNEVTLLGYGAFAELTEWWISAQTLKNACLQIC